MPTQITGTPQSAGVTPAARRRPIASYSALSGLNSRAAKPSWYQKLGSRMTVGLLVQLAAVGPVAGGPRGAGSADCRPAGAVPADGRSGAR